MSRRRARHSSPSSGEQEKEEEEEAFRSDDEEGNADLSLAIVAKAKGRCVPPLDSTFNPSDAERFCDMAMAEEDACGREAADAMTADSLPQTSAAMPAEKPSKKKLKKKKKNKKQAASSSEAEAVAVEEEETNKDLLEVESDAVVNNVVFQKLLRGPRYFDLPEEKLCYNCGKEGHLVADCTDEPCKKPCYTCGEFSHEHRDCPQGCCFICKGIGHFAKSCPKKEERFMNGCESNRMCLLCGEMGHGYSMCYKGYSPADMERIQCYVCKKYGHLCCMDIMDSSPMQISCYNCGEIGHAGVGCAKRRTMNEDDDRRPAKVCYRCGQEGHFARGCSMPNLDRWFPDPPMLDMVPAQGFLGFKSVPRMVGAQRWKDLDERNAYTPDAPRRQGRWKMDMPTKQWSRRKIAPGFENNGYSEERRHGRFKEHASPQLRKRHMRFDSAGGSDITTNTENHFKRRGERGHKGSGSGSGSGKKKFLQ